MQTVFSHIVQKRLSQENENVATEALNYILRSSEAARGGMLKILHAVAAVPDLRFRTQESEGNSRPDMCGCDDDGKARVYIENKFWAGLTDNQPVSYLQALARYPQPTILAMVGPEARLETLWRHLTERLKQAGIATTPTDTVGIFRTAATADGPIMALTSWRALLNGLDDAVVDDAAARNDLQQLKSLCEAADSQAYMPLSAEQLTDQVTPAVILQLSTVWQAAVDVAASQSILSLKGTTQQASPQRIGRYAYLGVERRAGLWIGIHFDLWKTHGRTPFWVQLNDSQWGPAKEVQALLEPWAAREQIVTANSSDGAFAVALDIAPGADKDEAVAAIVGRLRAIAAMVAQLEPPAAREAGQRQDGC